MSANTYKGSGQPAAARTSSAARILRQEHTREQQWSQVRSAARPQQEQNERLQGEIAALVRENQVLHAQNQSLHAQNAQLARLVQQMNARYTQLTLYIETLRDWAAKKTKFLACAAAPKGRTGSENPSD